MILGIVENSIVIKATPMKAWEMLDFDRLSEWSKGLGERVKYTLEKLYLRKITEKQIEKAVMNFKAILEK
jgi:hypothetical protein